MTEPPASHGADSEESEAFPGRSFLARKREKTKIVVKWTVGNGEYECEGTGRGERGEGVDKSAERK